MNGLGTDKFGESRGAIDLGGRGLGLVLACFGWALILVAVFFLDRANDYFYEVADNRLIEYGVVGWLLVGLVCCSVLTAFVVWERRGPLGILLVITAATAFALTIYASYHLGTHPAYEGPTEPNDVAVGTMVSVVGASFGLTGSLLLVWPRRYQ